jgi:hypothetical protein
MSRRRYLSTDVSIDPRVADLIADYGDFAGLLYTWLIPHAADDATVPRNPRVVLMAVVPGLGKTAQDAARALDGMVELGLLEVVDDARLRFPESFYRHQTYIKGERRGTPQPEPPTPPAPVESTPSEGEAQNSAEQRTSPQASAEQRPTRAPAQFSSSSSSSLLVSSSSSSPDGESAPADADVPGKPDVEREIYDYFKSRIAPLSRTFPRKRIAARLKKFSADELRQGIDHFVADAWWMEHNASRGADWFFDNDARSEQFLLLKPRPKVVPINGKVAADEAAQLEKWGHLVG